jgi:serine/threonine protein kinase
VQNFYAIEKTFSNYFVGFSDLWLENGSLSMNNNENGLILYIQMDLCDTTLQNIINQMFVIRQNKTLTLLGFYIASHIFGEILKGVNLLHKSYPQILHCDLYSENILIEKITDFKEKGKHRINVRISDFGLAKICELAQKSETVLPKSSSNYSSLQESSDGSYTFKKDIYALADIWIQLFCIDPNR